jgi:ankyrin repeat protein
MADQGNINSDFTEIFPRCVVSFLIDDPIKIEDSLEKVQNYLLKDETDIKDKDSKGRTLLHIACIFNNLPIVEFLIANGADVNSQDDYGRTPIHYSISFNSINKNAVNEFLLIDCGADMNIKDNDGYSPYDCVLFIKYTFLIKLMDENAGYIKPAKKV